MKRGLKLGFLIGILLILIGILIILPGQDFGKSSNLGITGKAVYQPPTMNGCTEEEMIEIWESIFTESPEGTTVGFMYKEDGKCPGNFSSFIYKIKNENEVFMLSVSNFNEGESGVKTILADHGNFSDSFIEDLQQIDIESTEIISSLNLQDESRVTRDIKSSNEAENVFKEIFNVETTEFEKQEALLNGHQSYFYKEEQDTEVYLEEEIIETDSEIEEGSVDMNTTFESFMYSEVTMESSSCTPNWQPVNTSCSGSETLVQYYVDENNCGTDTGKPINQTFGCDNDGDGFIGNVQNAFDDEEYEIKIDDETYNSSERYNGEKYISLKNRNKQKVDFEWDFSKALDIRNAEIKIQNNSFDYGYTIVNGLDVEKTIYIDKKRTDTDSVCVKQDHINNIDEITRDCFGDDETIVDCPGSEDGISCGISEGEFVVTGVESSGVKEFFRQLSLPQTEDCTPNWSCNDWSQCVGGKQIRICLDLNSCGDNSTEPSEERDCSETPGTNSEDSSSSSSSCDPSWACGDWSECNQQGYQTRNCDDINYCGLDIEKPEERRECQIIPEKDNIEIIANVIFYSIIFFFSIIYILVVYYFIKRRFFDSSLWHRKL